MENIGVYKAIAAIQGDLSATGIAKDKRNTQGSGYNLRGIDDVYQALSPLLAKHSLVVIPRVMSRECVERTAKSGGALFYVNVDVEFDFVSAIDGSKHTARMAGEAMDSGDKATNKAMSAAYKYAAFQVFCIPVEGDSDADSTTHEVKPAEKKTHSATDGALEALSPQDRKKAEKLAIHISTAFAAGEDWSAFEAWEAETDTDFMTGVWSLLNSKVRAKIKEMKKEASKPVTA